MARKPNGWQALIPIALTSILLLIAAGILGTSMHVPLLLGALFASILGLFLGYRFDQLQKMMVSGVVQIIPVMLILILVGGLMGVWIASGTVPAMVYYGLRLISPSTFLPLAFLLCAGVSLSIGTAFGTTSTIGLAMLGIGQALGLPQPVVVGAIVSGVYFGDRLSPLGSALNLAAAITETDIYDIMKHMLTTTILPFVLSLGFYVWQGNHVAGQLTQRLTVEYLEELRALFVINPWLLLPPILVIVLAAMRTPAIPTLMAGMVSGATVALLFQRASFAGLFTAVQQGYAANSNNLVINQLLNRGGIASMVDVLTLLIIAMSFSGLLEGLGAINALLDRFVEATRTVPSLVAKTAAIGTVIAMISANQSLPIIVTGRALRTKYTELGLAPKNLARTLLDSASILCPLIPWNLNGLFMVGVLGVSVSRYAPYALYCWLMPLMTYSVSFFPRFMPTNTQAAKTIVTDNYTSA